MPIGIHFARCNDGMHDKQRLTPIFVKAIPDLENLKQGNLYISMKYGVVVNYCPCGCGDLSEFTLAPERWWLAYNGETVSLFPSIGNSRLKCRSHYWIESNRVRWCNPMSAAEAAAAQEREEYVRNQKYCEKVTLRTRIAKLIKKLKKSHGYRMLHRIFLKIHRLIAYDRNLAD